MSQLSVAMLQNADYVPGVFRVSKKSGNRDLWYWQVSWWDQMVSKTELYSEARFGPEEAQKLATEARRVEAYYSRLLRFRSPITKKEWKRLRVERLEAQAARKELLSYKTSPDGHELVKGVDYDPRLDRFMVRWYDRRKRKTKSFSVKKQGFEKARELAIEFRMARDDERVRRFFSPDSSDEENEPPALH